jgi:conjugative relaxase-like TrwC/TraI family protein
MITARPQKNLKAAKEYFRKHLARGDYYSQGRTIAGAWLGKGVARLGLDPAQPVSEKAFVRLCENRHPLTGAQLTVRRRVKNRRVFYDFVASAPKSVSIMALTAGDSRILAAHDEACRIAMQRLEELAGTRIRKGGQRAERNTGEFVAACFRHEESRALDPQLHTHIVIFNATWDPVEKRWKALETSAMYEQIICTRKCIAVNWRSGCALSAINSATRPMVLKLKVCHRT